MTLLRTDGLTKRFGELAAVDGVDYHIEEGETASIIGPNGAGKTTFFNLITGEYEATSGTITFKGSDVTDLPPHERVSRGMGRVFQISNIFPELTTFENVRLALQSREVQSRRELVAEAYENQAVVDEAHEILEELELYDDRTTPAENLSHGSKRRLEIGMALALEPDLLLMDEPTAGLADEEVREITEFIRGIADDYTILLVEHKMDVVMGLSDRISVLHMGELVADDTVEGIKNNERVQEVYLGEESQYA
jgi:branched-chain amino acid transport system ATP-binding protein